VIDFLEKFRYLAAVLVLLSVPAFVIFAVIPVLFCDQGPFSSRLGFAAYVLEIPILQTASLVTPWIFRSGVIFRSPPVS